MRTKKNGLITVYRNGRITVVSLGYFLCLGTTLENGKKEKC